MIVLIEHTSLWWYLRWSQHLNHPSKFQLQEIHWSIIPTRKKASHVSHNQVSLYCNCPMDLPALTCSFLGFWQSLYRQKAFSTSFLWRVDATLDSEKEEEIGGKRWESKRKMRAKYNWSAKADEGGEEQEGKYWTGRGEMGNSCAHLQVRAATKEHGFKRLKGKDLVKVV